MPAGYAHRAMFTDFAIRDTTAHDPASDSQINVFDTHTYIYVIVKAINTHDQTIRLTFRSHMGASGREVAASLGEADDIATADVLASDEETRILSIHDGSKPAILVISAQVVGAVAPTSGNINVFAHAFGIIPGMET